ncbi:MAG: hypothetical protein P8R37_01045 [Opitutae bacterium]|nr:hypothetical protein [Opitutae bacterium]
MVRQSSEKIVSQYRKIAQQLKVDLTEPTPQLAGFIRAEPFVHGVYRQRELSISVPGKGLQNTRQIETIIKVQADNETFTWQITAAGLLGGLRQRDSGSKQRWLSGDSLFDSAIDLRSNDDVRLARIFHRDRRALIATVLKDSKGTIALRGGVLSFSEFGLIADDAKRERFLQLTELICDLAEAVEGRQGLAFKTDVI